MNNHSVDMLKAMGKLNREISIKKITQNYIITSQNKNEFIIGDEINKQKIGKEIHHINQLELGEFVLFDGKVCQVTKLFDISNNARLATQYGARNVILGKNCNLFRLLSTHTIGNVITPDRINSSVNHISKLKDNQWVLYQNKLSQVIEYNSVKIRTDNGHFTINLNKDSLTTLKD